MKAVSVGSRVPAGDFAGSVHSAFQTAANVAVEGEEILLALFVSDNTDLPQGVRLPRQGVALLNTLRAGQRIICRAGVLRSAEGPLLVDLNGAARYDGTVGGGCPGAAPGAEGSRARHAQARAAAWSAALRALNQRQVEKNTDLRVVNIVKWDDGESSGGEETAVGEGLAGSQLAGRQAEQRARLLARAARQTGAEDLEGLARALVGLGGGLTPTGDDFLVGFLAGLRASLPNSGEQSQRREEWLRALSAFVRAASRGTGDISRTYLLLAADGQFSSSLAALAGAICAGERAEAARARTEIVFQTGHSSGMDAASGLLSAFAAWNENWTVSSPS